MFLNKLEEQEARTRPPLSVSVWDMLLSSRPDIKSFLSSVVCASSDRGRWRVALVSGVLPSLPPRRRRPSLVLRVPCSARPRHRSSDWASEEGIPPIRWWHRLERSWARRCEPWRRNSLWNSPGRLVKTHIVRDNDVKSVVWCTNEDTNCQYPRGSILNRVINLVRLPQERHFKKHFKDVLVIIPFP